MAFDQTRVTGVTRVLVVPPLNIAQMPAVEIAPNQNVNVVEAADGYTGVINRSTSYGDQRSVGRHMLLSDTFEGNTLDAAVALNDINRWITATGNGGTLTVASGRVRLSTSPNANGRAQMDSQLPFGQINGTQLWLRGVIAFVDSGMANNVREFGFRDDAENTKYYFQLDNETLMARIDNAGANVYSHTITDPIAGDNGNLFWLAEIELSKQGANFYANDQLLASAVWSNIGRATPMTAVTRMRAYAMNRNTASAATDKNLDLATVGVYLMGDIHEAPSRIIRHTSASSAVLVRGAGILEGVRTAAIAGFGGNWTLYDNTAAAGRILLVQTGFAAGDMVEQSTYFGTGLYLAMAGEASPYIFLYVRS